MISQNCIYGGPSALRGGARTAIKYGNGGENSRMAMDKTVVLIPAYEPVEELLIPLMEQFEKMDFLKIVLVDDGSGPDFKPVFDRCRAFSCSDVTGYEVNHGKGYALKYGFRYILDIYPECECIVTADSDGQHLPEDIAKVAQATMDNPECLVLGSRNCLNDNVPARSRFGNVMTRNVFRIASGIKIQDTQTGLRGFTPECARAFLGTAGNRFEYEMNMLMEARAKGYEIKEIPIQTVYINDNKSTHFSTVKDSMRVYSVFFKHIGKFILSSICASCIDILLFNLLFYVAFSGAEISSDLLEIFKSVPLLVSFLCARLVSSTINFIVNKRYVFHDKGKTRKELPKYYVLVACIAVCTYLLMAVLRRFIPITWLCQLLATMIMFTASYTVQRKAIF